MARFLRSGRLLRPSEEAAFLRDFNCISLATQLGPAGLWNLETAVRRLIASGRDGAFVECGTWRGGALAFFARSLLRQGGDPRRCRLYGFDSFQGMPRMTEVDGAFASRWLYGRDLADLEPELLDGALIGSDVNRALESDCQALIAATGYPADQVEIVPGWFQDTLPTWRDRIGPIAVLRIDGDFYEATRACLETLYDSVIPNGLIIIDDYGMFEGCRRATSEFLVKRGVSLEILAVDISVVSFSKPG